MTAEEDIPSSFAHSVPPSFSLICINNWGLSRKRHMVRKWEPSTKDFSSISAGSEEDYFYADMIWTTLGLIAGLFISSLLPWSYWLMRFLTLCPGSRWVLPVWPTTKWTSAISSLLNITEFLGRERNKRRHLLCKLYSVHFLEKRRRSSTWRYLHQIKEEYVHIDLLFKWIIKLPINGQFSWG